MKGLHVIWSCQLSLRSQEQQMFSLSVVYFKILSQQEISCSKLCYLPYIHFSGTEDVVSDMLGKAQKIMAWKFHLHPVYFLCSETLLWKSPKVVFWVVVPEPSIVFMFMAFSKWRLLLNFWHLVNLLLALNAAKRPNILFFLSGYPSPLFHSLLYYSVLFPSVSPERSQGRMDSTGVYIPL